MLFIIIHLQSEIVGLEIAHENWIKLILLLSGVSCEVFLLNFICIYH